MIGPLDILPKSIAPAVLVYLAVSYGLGDVFAARVAERVHIPACVKGRVAEAARADHARDMQRRIARDLLGTVLRSAPQLRALPGVRAVEGLSQRPAARNHGASAMARCRCLAAAARSETTFDHMFWVASLRFHEPAGVSGFDGVMARLDHRGVCGAGGRP